MKRTPDEIAENLREIMLRKLLVMARALPRGFYTEIKGEIYEQPGVVGTFKLRDFAATIKDVASSGRSEQGEGFDVEDLTPLVRLLSNDTEED